MSSDDAKSDLEKMIDCSYICQWWDFAESGVMSWGNIILMLHGACMLMPDYVQVACDLTFLRELADARRDLDERLTNVQQRIAGTSGIEWPRKYGKSFLQQAIAESEKKELDNSLSQSIMKLFDTDQGGRK